MSDIHDQIERKLAESDVPEDVTTEEPMSSDPHPDRTRENARTSFSRMRTSWEDADARMLMEMEAMAERIVRRRFAVIFAVRARVHAHVRSQAFDEKSGAYLTYDDGTPMWVTDEFGVPVEDWGMLADRDRENLLGVIATHMFEWEIAKANTWFEAMTAKGQWEEVFSRGYTAMPGHLVSGKPTIEDRTHHSQKNAASARYFALFESYISRMADGLVASVKGLQRVLENTGAR